MVLITRDSISKNSLVLGVCPVGELVMAENEVLGSTGVVLVDEPMVVLESFFACCKLIDVVIRLVEAGSVVYELELIGADGCGGSNEGRES